MKNKIILAISILAGVVGFFLTYKYLDNQRKQYEKARQELNEGIDKIWVISVVRDLPKDTVLIYKDLQEQLVNKRDVGNMAILKIDLPKILGKKLKYPMQKNTPLTWSVIDLPYLPGSGLASIIKSGLRAVSISVGGASAVSGLVQPNDHVDILGTFAFPSKTAPGEMETVTLTVLQNVTVLACGQLLAKSLQAGEQSRRSASSYSTLTLEVSPREAELLVFAENMKGKLTLTLRNPEDITSQPTMPSINFKYLETSLPELNRVRQQTIMNPDRRP